MRRTDVALIEGAIDLYVHSSPDLIERVGDDWALAAECAAAGLAAAVHRNHHSPTAERSRVVRAATGFPLLGAVLLNGPVGGINPYAAELALRMGAVWIGFPTVGARAYRARVAEFAADHIRDVIMFGKAELVLTADDGSLLPEVREVLELAAQHEAAVGLGYSTFDETRALVAAGSEHGVGKMVLTNAAATMALSFDQIDELMATPGVFLEVTTHSFHPSLASHGRAGQVTGEEAAAAAVELLRRYGVDRCVVSSDGGIVGAPSATELFATGCSMLLAAGLGDEELDVLIRENPRHLVGAALPVPVEERA